MASTAALLWTEDEVATAMGVTVDDVAKLVAAGELGPVRILESPTLRFRPADVADLVDRLAQPVARPDKPAPPTAGSAMNALIRGGAKASS